MTAFDTRALIASVAGRLKLAISGVEVALTPERPQSWRLNHPKAALLVSYRGSRYAAMTRMGQIVQPRTLEIVVHVVARALHEAYGAVPLVDAVRQALLGFVATDAKAMTAVSDRFVSEEGGVWIYEIVFAAETLAIGDKDGVLPVLTRGTADYGFETEDIQ